jgi:hypothetical protein
MALLFCDPDRLFEVAADEREHRLYIVVLSGGIAAYEIRRELDFLHRLLFRIGPSLLIPLAEQILSEDRRGCPPA